MSSVELILIIAGFLVAVFGGDPIVQAVLLQLERNASTNVRAQLARGGLPNAGRYIGYLERALVYFLFIYRQPGSIAFIVAAKAIIRFQSSKDRPFAEYFLVGTFTSILIAGMIAAIILGPGALPGP
jgi:hypothetical protein